MLKMSLPMIFPTQENDGKEIKCKHDLKIYEDVIGKEKNIVKNGQQ